VRASLAYRVAYAVQVILTVSAGPSLLAQPARDSSVAPVDLPTAARSIIEAATYATFITTDRTGRPQARTVQPMPPTSDWEVWFATNPRTRKVGEIRRDARVAMHYFDKPTLSYVTVLGRAAVITDRATKDAHWNPAWSEFYPDRDTSVVLVRVRVERLEVVSTGKKIVGDARTWRPPSVTVRTPKR
jgi:general stress protein 26